MALGHSPSIVRNGLVMYYDMSNTKKSWMGAPTTNELVAVTWTGDGVNQSGFVKGTSAQITEQNLMYNGLETYLWSPGASLNCYLNGGDLSAATSTDWVFSCFIRAENRQDISALNVYMYFPSSDGASAGTITDMGNGWYYVYRTRTGVANILALIGFTGFSANTKYYLSGAMLEKRTIPSYPVITAGTRSTTQSILDLAGSNTITASSLTYAANNTFSFNGTSNYIAGPNIGSLSRFSVESWVKINALPAIATYPAIVSDIYPSTNSKINFAIQVNSNGTFNGQTYQAGWYSTNTQPIVVGVWQHLVYTYDGANQLLYLNGIANTPVAYIGTPVAGTSGLLIGRRHDLLEYVNGSIPSVKIYNRALTATEVSLNFEAMRDRYGI